MRTTRAMALGVAAATALTGAAARADELPVSIQAKLLSTMPSYIADLAPGGAVKFKLLVVHSGGEATPTRGAQAIAGAVGQLGKVGGLAPEVTFTPFAAAKLQAALAAQAPNAVYLAPELDAAAAAAVVEACGAAKLVTFTGVDAHVKAGAVMGFSLVEARPRVLVNLKQANRQGVGFLRGVLAHAVIVER